MKTAFRTAIASPTFSRGLAMCALFAAFAATGCSNETKADAASPAAASPAAAPTPSAATASPTLTLEGFGLTVTPPAGGKPQRLRFGGDQKATIAAVSAVLGKPSEQGTNSDCPSGPVQFAAWSKGLSANFAAGKFVGWTGAVDLKTARAIGFGSTKAALVKAYHPTFEETTLGTEFTVDGITGVMESDAEDAAISDLWSGMSCVAR
jgi:hypothetical protein